MLNSYSGQFGTAPCVVQHQIYPCVKERSERSPKDYANSAPKPRTSALLNVHGEKSHNLANYFHFKFWSQTSKGYPTLPRDSVLILL